MDNIRIFQNEQFGQVRIAMNEKGEPLFCLADVCKSVELTNPSSVKSRLDKEDVQLIDLHALNYTEGIGNTLANFITESGFYDVLLQSSSKKVKPFRKWVTSEVLPSIRKTGGYMIAKEDDAPEEIMARALLVAQETLKRKQKQIEFAEKKIAEQAPKVLFADSVSTSKTSILIGDLAKILKQNGVDIGAKRLFDWMRRCGYLIKQKGMSFNMPTQKSMDQKLFEIKETVITHSDGHTSISKTVKVTGIGQIHFVNKFLNRRIKAMSEIMIDTSNHKSDLVVG